MIDSVCQREDVLCIMTLVCVEPSRDPLYDTSVRFICVSIIYDFLIRLKTQNQVIKRQTFNDRMLTKTHFNLFTLIYLC